MKKKYIPYVNVLQGTKSVMRFSNGNTLPLVQRPFGMISFSPQTDGGSCWWFCPDTPILEGIRLTHQPSPWIGDYGTILITPQADKIADEYHNAQSSYRRCDAVLRPDYMRIKFLRQGATLEMTPTDRCASFRISFENEWERCVTIFNLLGSATFEIKDGMILGTTDGENGSGIANNFKMYFVIKPQNDWICKEKCRLSNDKNALHIVAEDDVFECNFSISISYISFEQALENLKEIGDRDFDSVQNESENEWEQYLSHIEIDSDIQIMKTFYSCLYRTGLFPHKAYEVTKNGECVHYSPYTGTALYGKRYTDNGFWDTFRTEFPLFSLICPDLYRDILEGVLCDYNECGFLPRWVSPGEVGCMPSTLIDSVIAQAATCKIIEGDLLFSLLHAMKHHANNKSESDRFGRTGITEYNELGYVPCDKYKESVNLTLDFAYGDYCIAKTALAAGDSKAEKEYLSRSKNYRNIFDTETNFMRGKTVDGNWREDFDPYEWGVDYTEASAWQTTMSVPHDFDGLTALFGGKEKILDRMDKIFSEKPKFRIGNYSSEIHEMSEMATANLGLCAISNQPSFLLPFIYAYFGETGKTEKWVKVICDTVFSSEVDGFPGDEDNGSMSAWYIFAMLGLYPFCPADDFWVKFSSSVDGCINGEPILEWKKRVGKNNGI